MRFTTPLTRLPCLLNFKPDDESAWNNRGIALGNLGRYEEAIASFDKALELRPDYSDTFYSKACCYAFQANTEAALENLSRAITLNPHKYRDMPKTDSDFASIRENEHFKALVAG